MPDAVPVREIGRFDDLGVHEYTCTFGPEDRPFDEQHGAFTIGLVYEGSGGTDNGAPGPRESYGPTYYADFVHDPDGNNVEAVTQGK